MRSSLRALLLLLIVGPALHAAAVQHSGGSHLGGQRRPWVEPISWKPRAAVHHNLITDEEAEHIIQIARPFMRRSTVVGAGGKSVVDPYRTSYGTFLKRYQDPVVASLERRVAEWTKLPIDHQEAIQVLRYGHDQFYKHQDSLSDDSPRYATVLVYLTDVEEGGETTFSESDAWINPALPATLGPYSQCAKGKVAFKPKRGEALVFHSFKPDGQTMDPAATHTGCPVIKGVKWVAIFWIHTKPFRPEEIQQQPQPEEQLYPEDCADAGERCGEWAVAGECERNPGFMLPSVSGLGTCRAACRECTICAPGDTECKQANRERAGYLRSDIPL